MTVPLSLPWALTISVPPDRIVVAVAAPPDSTTRVMPALTTKPLMLP
jgi:hypothetical protein